MKKKAIEIWSLYSYNLHNATFRGLNQIWENEDGTTNEKLLWRKNRRNFVIGRGSFAGMHRYAGLWTGDNASTWDFLSISVAQVLALGLSGVTISGADVGGFEFTEAEKNYANPELLIRWYCAYSLLPWFRYVYSGINPRHLHEYLYIWLTNFSNHYTKYRNFPNSDRMRKDGKLFQVSVYAFVCCYLSANFLLQEPYEYQRHYNENRDRYDGYEAVLYRAVLPTCRYFVRLRYSLMQLLYDAMFENMITGLPIARAMVSAYIHIFSERSRLTFQVHYRRTGPFAFF